jgi:hypothetical protein
MQVSLTENPSDGLTNKLWEQWSKDGIHSRYLTWIELNNLAKYFLKICKQKELDYHEFDFYTLIDSNLNFYENRAELDNQLGQPETSEKEQYDKLKDYFNEEQAKEFTEQERTTIEDIQQQNQTVEKKLNKVLKTQETTEQFKDQIQQIRNTQNIIMAKLDNLPNLENQIKALLKSQSFKDLGNALKPAIEQSKPTPPPKPAKKQIDLSLLFLLIPKLKMRSLDSFAGAMVFLMWIGFSWGILENITLSWPCIAALGVLWLGFIVAFRLVVRGILN